MKTNRTMLMLSMLICVALLTASCSLTKGRGLAGGVPGSGNIQTEERDTGEFEAIVLEYPGAEVTIKQGEQDSLQVQADDNLLPQLSTEVVSGRLIIKSLETEWEASVSPSQTVKITITVHALKEIVLSAPVSTVQVDDIQAASLKLVVSGGAQVIMNRIQVDVLDAEFSGAGDIRVNGKAQELKLVHSGLGSFNAAELPCRNATVELSGMGDATVWVNTSLKATITGAGSINYYGNPSIEQNLNGAGSVKPAG